MDRLVHNLRMEERIMLRQMLLGLVIFWSAEMREKAWGGG